MKYGIYYAYWERQWGCDYVPYIKKAAALGFDILEISCASLSDLPNSKIEELLSAKKDFGIALTAGYGPKASENIASKDASVVENAMEFWKKTFIVLNKLDINIVGGGLYSYWPVDYTKPVDKQGDWERSVRGVRKLADIASDYGITLCMEVLNRHEGYLLNTSEEGTAFVNEVDKPNVKVMLDTYHMNMEEEDFAEAIDTAGKKLGHFHIGECNRRLPGQGKRVPWKEIGAALRKIGYNGAVVMEPFVLTGGQVGTDIRVWRDLSHNATVEQLDEDAKQSVLFIRDAFKCFGSIPV